MSLRSMIWKSTVAIFISIGDTGCWFFGSRSSSTTNLIFVLYQIEPDSSGRRQFSAGLSMSWKSTPFGDGWELGTLLIQDESIQIRYLYHHQRIAQSYHDPISRFHLSPAIYGMLSRPEVVEGCRAVPACKFERITQHVLSSDGSIRNRASQGTQITKNPQAIPMSKKMDFASLFKQRGTASSWAWPSCKQPRTESFRWWNNDAYKPEQPADSDHPAHSSDSWFTDSTEAGSFSTSSSSQESGGESLESVVLRGVCSDRFFFEPGDTKSIVEEAKAAAEEERSPFEESVALAVESDDPYVDFRASMEEMVEAYGLKDWEWLMELLQWYLNMNGKKAHEYIVGAFVDLLVGIVSTSLECDEDYASIIFGDLIQKKKAAIV
ncbi:hypothetical protein ACLOJK_005954 [Asimina triloba]